MSQKTTEKTYFAAWRLRPDLYFKDALGVRQVEDYQKKILETVVNNKRIAIKACHSVGKTWTMARVALWFFNCYPKSIIITTAPTNRQVKALLWGELRDAYKNARLPVGGRLLETELKKSDKWYAVGYSPQKKAGETDEQKSSSFQGFHSDYVLVIFDEATGVDIDIWKMAEGLLTSGKMVKFIAIGNPTTRNCHFFTKFSSKAWKSVKLSCFDSPNMKANGFMNKYKLKKEIDLLKELSDDDRLFRINNYKRPTPHLLTADWVVDYILEFGFDHPLVVSKVFGDFPTEDENTLIQLSYVENAQARKNEIQSNDVRYIGVDVARYGNDKSVITEIIGYKQTGKTTKTKQDTMEIAGAVVETINNDNEQHKTIVLIDATGIGAGVFDSLVESRNKGIFNKDVEILEIHFGSSPVLKSDTDKEQNEKTKKRFFNLKARIFDYLANDLKHHLDILDDKIYLKELPMLKSKVDSKSKIRMESKDEYRKRVGGTSPDDSDSLALANFGRYVSIAYGSFTDIKKAKTKTFTKKGERKAKSRIRPKEY